MYGKKEKDKADTRTDQPSAIDSLPARRVVVKRQTVDSEEKARLDYFSAAEHAGIGNAAFELFYSDSSTKEMFYRIRDYFTHEPLQIRLSKNKRVSPGDIIALAGDFYGTTDYQPISILLNGDSDNEDNKKARFRNAFQTLIDVDVQEIESLTKLFRNERESIITAVQSNNEAHVGYEETGVITANWPFTRLTKGRYIQLLLKNLDHFGEQAREAYRIGHEVALETALEAFSEKQKTGKLNAEKIVLAINQELFACHFLTDLFASGHMQTPRLEILNYVKQNSIFGVTDKSAEVLAGVLAMKMHDEENDNGLIVESDVSQQMTDPNKRTWLAKGDHCYYDSTVQDNAYWVGQAVLVSLLEIHNACMNGKRPIPDSYSYLKYLPRVLPEQPIPPMFKVVGDTVELRKTKKTESLDDLSEYEYVRDWSPTLTFFKGKAKSIEKEVKLKEEDKQIILERLGALQTGGTSDLHGCRN